jgi:hypothetical protein
MIAFAKETIYDIDLGFKMHFEFFSECQIAM